MKQKRLPYSLCFLLPLAMGVGMLAYSLSRRRSDIPIAAHAERVIAIEDLHPSIQDYSPNKQFRLVSGKLEPSRQLKNKFGGSVDKSVFLIDLTSRQQPVEASESFRGESGSVWPKYAAYWSKDSTMVAVVASFPRDDKLAVYRASEAGLKKIDIAEFDPVKDSIPHSFLEPRHNDSEYACSYWHFDSIAWHGDETLALAETAHFEKPSGFERSLGYNVGMTNGWLVTLKW